MTKIESYMHDGAGWQPQAVLAYLRSKNEQILDETWNARRWRFDGSIEVGRYEEYLNQGYVISVVCYPADEKCSMKNYIVYQDKDNEGISVFSFVGVYSVTPSRHDKHYAMMDGIGSTKEFACGDIVGCGDWVADDMKQFIHTSLENANKETEE